MSVTQEGSAAEAAKPRISYPEADPDRMMFTGIDVTERPTFTVSEMARVFFARTNHWVRWLEAGGRMTRVDPETGELVPMGTRRTETTGGRIYTLADIEEIAHGLAANSSISGTHLRQTLMILRVIGEMYEYL